MSRSNIYSKNYKEELIEVILSKEWISIIFLTMIVSVDSNHTWV